MRCPYCSEKLYASFEIHERVMPEYGDIYENEEKNVIIHEDRKNRQLRHVRDGSLTILCCPCCDKILKIKIDDK